MANNDMKQIKFDMLVKDIDESIMGPLGFFGEKIRISNFSDIYDEDTPLCIFFDTKIGNDYRKSIFFYTQLNLIILTSDDVYSKKTFQNDAAKKIYLTKMAIKEYRDGYRDLSNSKQQYFIFWALLAACVDKTDYDEKISMIADFAHMVNIDENALFDITQVIKIVFGEEVKNIKFKTDNVPEAFENVLALFKK